MCDDGNDARQQRFAGAVLDLHERLSFSKLTYELRDTQLAYLAVRPDGLTTLAVTTAQLPQRYLMGIQGFRLAQYLQLGWACREVVYRQALFCERIDHGREDDMHFLTLSQATGHIVGYLGLAGISHEAGLDLQAPGRVRFPVEIAHGTGIFDSVAAAAGVPTAQTRELKRFVHRRGLADRSMRLRISLELLLAAGHGLLTVPDVRLLVGDLEEGVALRHLLLAGLEVDVIDGTTPALGESELMHLRYVRSKTVKPFVAAVPSRLEIRRRARMLEGILTSTDAFEAAKSFGKQMHGSVRKVAA